VPRNDERGRSLAMTKKGKDSQGRKGEEPRKDEKRKNRGRTRGEKAAEGREGKDSLALVGRGEDMSPHGLMTLTWFKDSAFIEVISIFWLGGRASKAPLATPLFPKRRAKFRDSLPSISKLILVWTNQGKKNLPLTLGRRRCLSFLF